MKLDRQHLAQNILMFLGVIILLHIVIAAIIFVYTFLKFPKTAELIEPAAVQVENPNTLIEPTTNFYSLTGTIKEMSETGLSITSTSNGETLTFSFEYDSTTKFASLSALNIAAGEKIEERASLSVGDTVAVYAIDEIGGVTPQIAREIVELTN